MFLKNYRLILILLLLINTVNLFSQPKSIKELSEKFYEILKTGNSNGLKSIQATPDIYRKIAPTQMEGKSDSEIMDIVNSGRYSIFGKFDEIVNDFKDASLTLSKIKFTGAQEKKYQFIKLDFTVIMAFCSYENVNDTLILEAYQKGNNWYLIDLSNDDRQLQNIINKKGKNDATIYLSKGESLMGMRKYSEAAVMFNKALELRKTNKIAYYNLAYCLIELSDYQKAEEALLSALQIDPNYAPAYRELGYVKSKERDNESAMKYYEKAIQLDSNEYFAYYYAGDLKYSEKDFTEAENFFDLAVRHNPSNFYQPYYKRGMARVMLKLWDSAKNDFNEALARNQKHVFSYYWIGWIENDLGEFNEAKKALTKGLSYDSTNIDCIYELGYANKKLENFSEALDNFKTVETLLKSNDPEFDISYSRLYNHLADCYFETGDKDKACHYYTLAADEGNSNAKNSLEKKCK